MPGVPPNPDPWLPTDPIPLNRYATAVSVYRKTAGNSGSQYQLLDNVTCEFIEQKQGTDPGLAGFRYKFTDQDPLAPQSFEQALDIGFTTAIFPKLVDVEDRIQVVAATPDGTSYWIFDGTVLGFGVALGGDVERVDFHAQGVAWTCWDSVIGGAYLRDASQPTADVGMDTDIVAQFNPRHRHKSVGNASPDGADHQDGKFSYPVFLDPLSVVNGKHPRPWTLAMAAKYLIYKFNNLELFVTNPDPSEIDKLLFAREPIDGTPFDPNDPSTYTKMDLACPDTPITGRDWPTVLHERIRDAGFGMSFDLVTNPQGNPQTQLNLYVLQGGKVKDLYLQPRGASLGPRYSNLAEASITRDLKQVINTWEVHGALERYEASFVLAPMFPMGAADGASAAAIAAFDRTRATATSATSDGYRLYGFDETGDGHYAYGSAAALNTIADLSALFQVDPGKYAVRRRPGRDELLTLDTNGLPTRAVLHYSTDYAGKYPAPWDGSGTWKAIDGGWRSRDDRLGIWVTSENPNHWSVGQDPTSSVPTVLKGVEAQCQVAAGKTFYLRYTTVIDADASCGGTAPSRAASPLGGDILRIVDARDRYFTEIVGPNSLNNPDPKYPLVKRDDTDLATAEATMLRTATEAGILEGTITIPYFTAYYEIGDRIRSIAGRGLGLRTDGSGPGDTPVYPVVVGFRWDLGSGQKTTLHISDEATERHTTEKKVRR
jgi:hypothetical protein